MAEYIEREALRKSLLIGAAYLDEDTMMTVVNVLDCFPAADVEPVCHGRWVAKNGRIVCSECDAIIAVAPNNDVQQEILEKSPIEKDERFCYNCGAKMDLEDTNHGK